jgi:hypothetical protein
MRRVFKDDVLQKKIESDGFVVIPFLDSEGVAKLKALYESFDQFLKKDF